MWVIPKAAGAHPWPLWTTIKESDWFLLTRNNAGLIVEKPYRIILKTGKNQGWLVAVGKEHEIDKAWEYIQENIYSSLKRDLSKEDTLSFALSKFQSLAVDENLKTLPSEAQASLPPEHKYVDVNMDQDEFDGKFYYESGDITSVERDLIDLAREDSFFNSNQLSNHNMANADTKLPKSLNIPNGEKVMALYSMSLWSTGLPRPGSVYVTQNFLAFYAPGILLLSSQNIVIPFTQIVHIQFFMQSGFECVQIVTKKSDETSSQSLAGFRTLAFASLYGGFQAFEFIQEIWKLSMKKLQKQVNDKKRVRDGEVKEEHLVTFEEAQILKQAQQKNAKATSANNNASSSSGNTNSQESILRNVRATLEKIRPQAMQRFRLPETEQLLSQAKATVTVYAKRGNSFVKSSTELSSVEGVIYLTSHFLVFQDSYLFKTSPLGQYSPQSSGKNIVSLQNIENDELANDQQVDDDAQSTAVMEAEWDVAAAEMDDNDPKKAQKIKKMKKNVPATSLATAPDAPSRLWFVIPLREALKVKIGKPTANVSTAYSQFGVTPYMINLHFPYNMYAFTLINRPNFFPCLSKVLDRVKRQESLRPPLAPYSIDLIPSSAEVNRNPSPQPAATKANLNTKEASQTDLMEPPPRQVYFAHVGLHPLSTGESKFPPYIFNDTSQFSSTHRARERLQEEKFLNYFHKYGSNTSFARKGPELPMLVRDGIPHSLRGHLWFTLSGAACRHAIAPKDYYRNLLASHPNQSSTAVEQIERDLYRSMPSHTFYSHNPTMLKTNTSASSSASGSAEPSTSPVTITSTEPRKPYEDPLNPPSDEPAGISRLRRVLVAYSWHNPVIGYCQSMNIVVSTLLLYMSEEEAFYTLITLVEYLEEYWTREMIGAVVDMHVLKDVLKMKKPALVAHLDSLDLDYSIVALPWFMCLFIGYVPLQLALRLMDCFFYNAGHGKATATLFQAAIALFSISEEPLLKCYDSVAVSEVVRQTPYQCDCDQLISLVFFDDSLSLRASLLEELRNFHRYTAIKNIEHQNQEEDFMTLVYGPQPGRPIPGAKTEADMPKPKRISNPPPTTPTHFQLKDLKRLYIEFKQAQQVQETVVATSNSSHHPPINSFADRFKTMNKKSTISSLSLDGFKSLFRQHFNWMPVDDRLFLHLFKWMDVCDCNCLSFVEYIQGIDLISFGDQNTIVRLIFDLLSDQPSSTHEEPSLSFDAFKLALRSIYFILLYSRSSEIETSESSQKPIRRRKLDMQTEVGDDLDDWLLLSADEQYENLVTAKIQQDTFASYSEKHRLPLSKYMIAVTNLLALIPPSSMKESN